MNGGINCWRREVLHGDGILTSCSAILAYSSLNQDKPKKKGAQEEREGISG